MQCLALLLSLSIAEIPYSPPQATTVALHRKIAQLQKRNQRLRHENARLKSMIDDLLFEQNTQQNAVLSLDGGGERGLLEVLFLEKLEALTGMHTSQLFNIFSGTSTGSIIAGALTAANPQTGKPLYRASDLLKFYLEDAAQIFPDPELNHWKSLDGIEHPIYEDSLKNELLSMYFGEITLGAALADDLIITSGWWSDANGYEAHVYRKTTEPNTLVVDATAASSNAPTYFILGEAPSQASHTVTMDGALFANNPADHGYAAAKQIFPGMPDPLVVSVGTGTYVTPPPTGIETGGLAKLLGVSIEGAMEMRRQSTDLVLQAILDANNNYERIEFSIDQQHSAMDDYTPEQIIYLISVWETYYKAHREELQQLADRLVELSLRRSGLMMIEQNMDTTLQNMDKYLMR